MLLVCERERMPGLRYVHGHVFVCPHTHGNTRARNNALIAPMSCSTLRVL